MSKALIQRASRTEFARYFWAGSLAFAVDFLVLFSLTEFAGLNYLWSNLVGVTVGIFTIYLLSIHWVFRQRRFSQVTVEFPLFFLTCMVGLLLNEGLLWATVEFGGLHYLAAKVIVTLVVFVFNFLLKKFTLFRR